MAISPLNYYFKHFAKHRELPGVSKAAIDSDARNELVEKLDLDFSNAMLQDNEVSDLDPVLGHVLTAEGRSHIWSMDEQGRHLRTLSAHGSTFLLSESHLSDRGFDWLTYRAAPGKPKTLTCQHVDVLQPQDDFIQRLELS